MIKEQDINEKSSPETERIQKEIRIKFDRTRIISLNFKKVFTLVNDKIYERFKFWILNQ